MERTRITVLGALVGLAAGAVLGWLINERKWRRSAPRFSLEGIGGRPTDLVRIPLAPELEPSHSDPQIVSSFNFSELLPLDKSSVN